MDKDLNNIVLETSMERYLMMKLNEQTQINNDLNFLISNNVKVGPEDLVRLKEIERLATVLVKEAMDNNARNSVIYNIGQFIRK